MIRSTILVIATLLIFGCAPPKDDGHHIRIDVNGVPAVPNVDIDVQRPERDRDINIDIRRTNEEK